MKDGPPQAAPLAGKAPPAGAPAVLPSSADVTPASARPAADEVDYRRMFRWAARVVRPVLGPFLLASVLTLLLEFLGSYNFQLLSSVIAKLTAGGDAAGAPTSFVDRIVPADVRVAAILLIVILFVRILLGFASRIATVASDNLMTGKLQLRLHAAFLRLGPGYHRSHDVGASVLTVTQFASGAQMILADILSFPLQRAFGLTVALVLLVGNLGKLGGAPPWLTAALIATLVVLPIGTWWLSRRLRGAFVRVREEQKHLQEELLDSLSQPSEVQIHGAEGERQAEVSSVLRDLVRGRIRAAAWQQVVDRFQTSIPQILQAVFLAYGVFLALRTGQPGAAGPILAIYYFVPQVVAPLQELLTFYVGIQTSWAQVEDVLRVLEAEPEIVESVDARDAPSGMVPLSLEGITFSYAPDADPILDDVTHTFRPGAITAIAARSGGGKSTVLHLLVRLYDPQRGAVRLGDHDLRDLKIHSLRRQVAKVSQFPLFFHDTIRKNLLLANPDATDDDLREAARKTGLWDVLERVAERGTDPLDMVLPRALDQGLSGGERRLLAITRALLTDPSVLLLDEPTTGVDALSRARIAQLLRHLARDMTIILVDHNLGEFVVELAAEVCVLDEGRFVEVGSPDELERQGGLFQALLEGEGPPETSS